MKLDAAQVFLTLSVSLLRTPHAKHTYTRTYSMNELFLKFIHKWAKRTNVRTHKQEKRKNARTEQVTLNRNEHMIHIFQIKS